MQTTEKHTYPRDSDVCTTCKQQTPGQKYLHLTERTTAFVTVDIITPAIFEHGILLLTHYLRPIQ